MEILFVSHKYPPSTGGMEKQSFELINGMKKLVKVHAIVHEGKESSFRFFRLLNKRIHKIIKDNPGIQIIHFNDGLIAAFSLFFTKLAHLKRTVTLHGLDVVFPSFIYQKLIFPLFNRFDLIIAVSHATATACEVRRISKEKIAIINNGVDTGPLIRMNRNEVDQLLLQKYGLNSKDKRLLVAMGRPVKRKGFSWFLKNVMPHLHDDFILLLIGPVLKQSRSLYLFNALPAFTREKIELLLGFPSDERSIEKQIKNQIGNRTIRLGKLPSVDIKLILGVADAFIMPNIEVKGDMEGFGLVCLEASMCGVNVIASASGGITDAIIPDRNGILLPPGNADAWIEVLNKLIEDPHALKFDPDEIISFTQNHFSWEKMCAEYLTCFSKLK